MIIIIIIIICRDFRLKCLFRKQHKILDAGGGAKLNFPTGRKQKIFKLKSQNFSGVEEGNANIENKKMSLVGIAKGLCSVI